MEIARKRGDEKLVKTAVDIVLASLEHGWDAEYGGLKYITNIDWTPTHELGANLKLWWPHCETLYALLLGWSLTGRDDLWQWYEKVHEYTFGHFPDPEYGEWYGYLDRDGKPVWTAKANGWKGFFHLPRVLFRCYQLLDQILEADPGKAADPGARDGAAGSGLRISAPLRGSALYLAGICLVASIGGLLFGFDTAVISGHGRARQGAIRPDRAPAGLVHAVPLWWAASWAPPWRAAGRSLRTQADPDRRLRLLLRLRSVLHHPADVHHPDSGPGSSAASAWAWPRCWRRCTSASSRRRISAAGWWLSSNCRSCSAFWPPISPTGAWLGFAEEPSPGIRRRRRTAPDPGGRGVARHVRRGNDPGGPVLLLLFFVPESPRWLAKEGRTERAFAILARVRGREWRAADGRDPSRRWPSEEGTLAANCSSRGCAWRCWWA